jgi:hypothetical protein
MPTLTTINRREDGAPASDWSGDQCERDQIPELQLTSTLVGVAPVRFTGPA